MKKGLALLILISAFLAVAVPAQSEETAPVPMAKLCGSCHEAQPGVMMGFLDNIAMKSKTILMDFVSHKEVVNFTDGTAVKYVEDLADIRNYRNKGFQINYIEINGRKIATAIIRFDIMKVEALSRDDFISREEFRKLRNNQNVKVYDVRPPAKYQMAHIPGAMMMPAPAFEKFKKNLPEDRATPIIYYGVGGCLSPTAALATRAMGFTDVKIFAGGFPDWSKSDLSITTPEWLKMAIERDIPHVLIDLRPADLVVHGHIPGAVNIVRNDLEKNRAIFPKEMNAPIILYGLDSKEAAEQIVSWGYRAVMIFPLSFQGWNIQGNPIATGPAKREINYVPKPKEGTISIDEFREAVSGMAEDMILVDVRNTDEFNEDHLRKSVNMPVDVISERAELMGSRKELILFCNTGARAEMAHNILNKDGVRNRYLDAIVTIRDGVVEVEKK